MNSRVHFSINFIKEEIVTDVSWDHTAYCDVLRLRPICDRFHVHFALLFKFKGTEQIYTEG